MFYDFVKQRWYRLIWDEDDNLLGSEWVDEANVPPQLRYLMQDKSLNPA